MSQISFLNFRNIPPPKYRPDNFPKDYEIVGPYAHIKFKDLPNGVFFRHKKGWHTKVDDYTCYSCNTPSPFLVVPGNNTLVGISTYFFEVK